MLSPLQFAMQLARRYGLAINEFNYLPTLSLVAKLKLFELTKQIQLFAEVESAIKPFLTGERKPLQDEPTNSEMASHWVFFELDRITPDPLLKRLALNAVGYAVDQDSEMPDAANGHNEMTDAIFMSGPLLVQAYSLTKDSRYLQMAIRHIKFISALNRRSDGLYRHSPIDKDQSAWGRGNGFALLGLALSLCNIPKDTIDYTIVLTLFSDHLRSLLNHQDKDGMWHQVIDKPNSYAEHSVTSMIALSIALAIRHGWIKKSSAEPALLKAWAALTPLSTPDGSLQNVCAGTGKMASLQEYLDRPCISGHDERGGGFMFLLSVELASCERDGLLKIQH